MNKYLRLIEELERSGSGTMKCFGNSMLPILANPSLCTYNSQGSYKIGDIVFCKVRGRFIDAHKIIKTTTDGFITSYLIANNRDYENGWTNQVFGRVVKAEDKNGYIKTF